MILNHLRSLIDVNSDEPFGTTGLTVGARVREKRRLQAEDLADLIASRINEKLVVLGDMNAFEFNDGLVDVIGTLEGLAGTGGSGHGTERGPLARTSSSTSRSACRAVSATPMCSRATRRFSITAREPGDARSPCAIHLLTQQQPTSPSRSSRTSQA